jgi:hypothetical protein
MRIASSRLLESRRLTSSRGFLGAIPAIRARRRVRGSDRRSKPGRRVNPLSSSSPRVESSQEVVVSTKSTRSIRSQTSVIGYGLLRLAVGWRLPPSPLSRNGPSQTRSCTGLRSSSRSATQGATGWPKSQGRCERVCFAIAYFCTGSRMTRSCTRSSHLNARALEAAEPPRAHLGAWYRLAAKLERYPAGGQRARSLSATR